MESVDLLRVLTLADPDVRIERLAVTVTRWDRPLPRWSGRLGHVMNLLSYAVHLAPGTSGPAGFDVRLTEPTPLADVARGTYPLLGVERAHHGYGYVQLGTVDPPASALALLPSRTAPGVPELPSVHLQGRGLGVADLGLVGSEQTRDRLRAGAADPELIEVGHPLLAHPSGHLAVNDRLELPLVDLNVHHPVGRLYTFGTPAGALALDSVDGDLSFRPRPGGRKPLDGWSRPATAPVTGAEVSRLRPVEEIDLSALEPSTREHELVLYRRLAELAATGVVLHSLPSSFTLAEEILGTTLATLLRAPYRSCNGLQRELRTVPQRREAMRRFGGFFELAEHAESLGHRLLPTVSVVLSTMRPARVAHVLTALAAQTYPHVEIAVALHGDDEPAGPDLDEAVRLSGAAVHRYDRSVPFGSVLADLARRTSGDLVVKIDDDDVYGPRVIEDLVLGYLYSHADVVGKTTEYLYFEDIDHTAHRRFLTESYHTQVAGGAMMLSRAALNEIGGWRPSPHSTDRSILIRIGNSGGICYRTQSLGYVYVRHSDGHTWKQEDSLLLRRAPEQWPRFVHEIVEA